MSEIKRYGYVFTLSDTGIKEVEIPDGRFCLYSDHLAEVERLLQRFTAPIVCICGSTRFKQTWISENARLTGLGNIVLAVGLWGHHQHVPPDENTKRMLDDLHKRKIDLCDWVWVLDVGGYIGESTKSEIEYAKKLGKPVMYLSAGFPRYTEPVDPLQAEIAALTKALDEATRCQWCKNGKATYLDLDNAETFITKECNCCGGSSRFYPNTMSTDSRALCERVLDKEER